METVEKEVTIEELKKLYDSNEYNIEIKTPDGFQELGEWYNKGVLEMVRVETSDHITQCSKNHLIQLADNKWCLAEELEPGVQVQTESGIESVTSVEEIESQECFDFEVLHDNHRYYGDGIVSHNSGKSYLCAGSIIKHAQEQGIFVVLIDSENALDQSWLEPLGVDTGEDKMLKLNMAMIDDVSKTIHKFMEDYKTTPQEERPKVLFVIDSLGMLMSQTESDQFKAGDLKGDMGRKAKQLKGLVTNCVNMFGAYNVGLVATNHTYASQDMFDPEDKISGGQGFVYASSIVVALKKRKLKEDSDGNKTSDVHGIRAAAKVMKTRLAKPFESMELKIPYYGGLDPYSGLLELFEKKGVIEKDGNKLKYVDSQGNEHKEYRKRWTGDMLDFVMRDYPNLKVAQEETTEEPEEEVDSETEITNNEDIINEENTHEEQ